MDYSKIGYNKPLYILAFDHRATFAKSMFNLESADKLSPEQRHLIKEFKMLIYKGFKDAIDKQIPKGKAAILCDEEFGSEVLIDAKENQFVTILTIEKSGQDEFDFMYENFAQHIENYKPTFAKVLIKYNPKDEEDLKKRQQDKLKTLSDFCHNNGYKFLLEVLVIPTKEQLESVNNSREEYDLKLRPELTAEVINVLQSKGVEPDIWKLEGMETETDYSGVIAEAKSDGRDNVGVVILGRGANEEKVEQWLEVGSKVKGVVGFAVGRTIFWDCLEKFYKKEIGKAEVIETISNNFQNFYSIFTSDKKVG